MNPEVVSEVVSEVVNEVVNEVELPNVTPNNELAKNDEETENGIDSSYDCSICHSLFVQPVTLLCQHTYCRQCIKIHYDKAKSTKKTPTCPLCNCGIIIPPNDNNLLVDIINLNYEDEYKERVEQAKKDDIKSDIKEEVKNELRKDLFSSLMIDPPSFEENTLLEKIKSWLYYLGSIDVFVGLMGVVMGMSYLKKLGINTQYIDNILFTLMYLWIICMMFTGAGGVTTSFLRGRL
jgi:hypothetical protein